MDRTNRILLLLALLFAVLVGLGAFRFFAGLENMAAVKYTDEVVVALRDIPARTVITREMVKVENVPTGTRHTRAASSLDTVVGKLTTQPIISGEQVLNDRLFSSAQQSGLAFQVPEGQRAVSIGINRRVAVSYLVRVGDTVDVSISYEPGGSTARDSSTVIMLQNIKVLAIGTDTRQGVQVSSEAETITLAVTPHQAEQLIWAEDYGRIRLLLRPAADNNIVNTPGQNSRTVVGGR